MYVDVHTIYLGYNTIIKKVGSRSCGPQENNHGMLQLVQT